MRTTLFRPVHFLLVGSVQAIFAAWLQAPLLAGEARGNLVLGDITAVNAGPGLNGGGTRGNVTLSVDTNEIQSRVVGDCAIGSAIRHINADGTVDCEADDNSGGSVTAVTASAPLVSSGGTAPNISLPDVIIDGDNIGIGTNALVNNTSGFDNTAVGSGALSSNTVGANNVGIGLDALKLNTGGSQNIAIGVDALLNNDLGGQNTAIGFNALVANTTGSGNIAVGDGALSQNTNGGNNTAIGLQALLNKTSGHNNTAVGFGADVSSSGFFINATAIGANAIVDASNKIRLGDGNVAVIEGEVAFTASSDATKKENFRPLRGEEILTKLRGLRVLSWNFIGHDPKQFRHYGPMAQDFFAAFGNDGVGTIGSPTTINSGDMAGILMSAIQALEKRTAENAELKARIEALERNLNDGAFKATLVDLQ